MKKSLLPLLLGGLGIGTTEFVMMGLLQDIASDLHVTIPEAGHLISAYALGVVVGAPLLVMMSVKHPPKKILLSLMAIFTVFNALSAFSPGPTTLLMARFFAGLPHGAFFGVGSVVASRLADKGKQAQAIAVMFSGLTIANLVMVPIGTWIGHHLLWRYTFGLVAVIGLITLLAIKLWLPALPANKNADPKKELEVLKNPQAWLVIAITAVGTGGMFAWISYISPLMTEISHFSQDSVSWIMVLAGFGMIVGNLIGGKLADRFQPVYTCAGLLLCMAVNLLAIHYFSGYQFVSLFLTFMTGALSMMIAAPIQILMINTSGDSEMLGAALIQAAFNVGNSLGAFLGGLPIVMGYGFTYPVVVGACMAVAGVGFAIRLIKMQHPPAGMNADSTTRMAA